MIKKNINDIIFKYQFSKFKRSSEQQAPSFRINMGANSLSYLTITSICFSPFGNEQSRGNISDIVLNSRYVPSQHDKSSFRSPEQFPRSTDVSTPNSQR